jgi:hypothetical protein
MEKLGQPPTAQRLKLSPSVPPYRPAELPEMGVPSPAPSAPEPEMGSPHPNRFYQLPLSTFVPQHPPTPELGDHERPEQREVASTFGFDRPAFRGVPQLPSHSLPTGTPAPTLSSHSLPTPTLSKSLPESSVPVGSSQTFRLPQSAPPPHRPLQVGTQDRSAAHPTKRQHPRLESNAPKPPVLHRVTTFYDL